MQIYNKWLFIFLLSAGSSGTTGCSPDKNNSQVGQAPWSAGEIQYIRRGAGSIKLKQAQRDYKTYRLDDEILFPGSAPTSDTLSIKISTKCNVNEAELPIHLIAEKLNSRYFIYELLPIAVLDPRNSFTQPTVRCQFDFVIKNARGDSHLFQMVPDIIDFNNLAALPVKQNIRPVKTEFMVPVLHEKFWMEYAVDSTIGQNLQLICEDLSATFTATHTLTLLAVFNLQPRETTDDKKIMLLGQYCRIFSLNAGGRIASVTYPFVLRQDRQAPIVRPLLAHDAPIAYNREFLVQEYEVINSSPNTIYLSLPKVLQKALNGEIVSTYNLRDFYHSRTVFDLYTRIIGAPIIPFDHEWRWQMTPHQSVRIQIYGGALNIACQNGHNWRGLFVYPANNPYFNLREISDPAVGRTSPRLTISSAPLEAVLTRRILFDATPPNTGSWVPHVPVVPALPYPTPNADSHCWRQ